MRRSSPPPPHTHTPHPHPHPHHTQHKLRLSAQKLHVPHCIPAHTNTEAGPDFQGLQRSEGRGSCGLPNLKLPRGKEKKEARAGAEDCELPRVDCSWPVAPSLAPCRALPTDRKGEAARFPRTRDHGTLREATASPGEGPGCPGSERTPESPSMAFEEDAGTETRITGTESHHS